MKRMRSKTILLNVRGVEADMYVLPNHKDYEYIDIYVSVGDGSDAQNIRVYKEQTGDIFVDGSLCIINKSTYYLSIETMGIGNFNIFAVGWK